MSTVEFPDSVNFTLEFARLLQYWVNRWINKWNVFKELVISSVWTKYHFIFWYYAMHMVHSLILGIYITRVMILGSPRVLITDQCSPRPFNCDIATSKIYDFWFFDWFLKTEPWGTLHLCTERQCCFRTELYSTCWHLPIGYKEFAYDQNLRQ